MAPAPSMPLFAALTGTRTTRPAAASQATAGSSSTSSGREPRWTAPSWWEDWGAHPTITCPGRSSSGAATLPTAPKPCCQAWPGLPASPGFAELKGHLYPYICVGSLGGAGVMLLCLHTALFLFLWCQTLGEDSNPLSAAGRWLYPQSLLSPGGQKLRQGPRVSLGL